MPPAEQTNIPKRALLAGRRALREGEKQGGKGSELYARNASSGTRRKYKIGYEGLQEVVNILASKS